MEEVFGILFLSSFGLKKQIRQDMIQIDKQLIQQLFDQAVMNPRLRQSFDLRTEATDVELGHKDNSQRILNALMPGTKVPIHRHPMSNETVICLSGKLVEVIYDYKTSPEYSMSRLKRLSSA